MIPAICCCQRLFATAATGVRQMPAAHRFSGGSSACRARNGRKERFRPQLMQAARQSCPPAATRQPPGALVPSAAQTSSLRRDGKPAAWRNAGGVTQNTLHTGGRPFSVFGTERYSAASRAATAPDAPRRVVLRYHRQQHGNLRYQRRTRCRGTAPAAATARAVTPEIPAVTGFAVRRTPGKQTVGIPADQNHRP